MNMIMLRDWLESEALEVRVEDNLADARQALLDGALDLVLLDVRLGPEDGLDLVRWMRTQANLRKLPVIAVTAHALRHEQDQILREGCNAVVSKPVDFRILRRHLDLWLKAGSRAPIGEAEPCN